MSFADEVFNKYKSGELTLPSKKRTKNTKSKPKRNKNKKFKNRVLFPLEFGQIEFLKLLKGSKDWEKVGPHAKGMITQSIRRKGILNQKHLKIIQKAVRIKGVSNILDESNPRFLNAKVNTIKPKKTSKERYHELNPKSKEIKLPTRKSVEELPTLRGYKYYLEDDLREFLLGIKQNKSIWKQIPPQAKGFITTAIKLGAILNDKHLLIIQKGIEPFFNNRNRIIRNNKELLDKLFNGNLTLLGDAINQYEGAFSEVYDLSEVEGWKQQHELYIGSGCWRRKRKYLLKTRGCKCQMCGDKSKKESEYHGHHNTYKRFGREEMNDIQILCNECHKGLHKNFTIAELELMFERHTYINGALVK